MFGFAVISKQINVGSGEYSIENAEEFYIKKFFVVFINKRGYNREVKKQTYM